MKCVECEKDMVQATATNFGEPYWYCRPCKKELSEMIKHPKLEPVTHAANCDHVFDHVFGNDAKALCNKCGLSGWSYLGTVDQFSNKPTVSFLDSLPVRYGFVPIAPLIPDSDLVKYVNLAIKEMVDTLARDLWAEKTGIYKIPYLSDFFTPNSKNED